MPLILSMNEGEDFYVADEKFYVENIRDNRFSVRNAKTGATIEVDDRKMLPLLTNVKVSCGLGTRNRVAKLVIDAPREIPVMQGNRYRRGREK